MVKDVLPGAKDRMTKAVESLRKDLTAIRTGRASAGLVDHVRVDYHGAMMPINQLATVAVPEPRLLTIQPWDRGSLGAIEKAIQKSDLGITPTNDGSVIRLSLPQLNEQRRKELAKMVQKRVEEGRVAVRNIRRDCHDELRKSEKNHEASEDEVRRATDQLQKLTDQFVAEMDKAGKDKEAELMEV
ncbi:MAG: ribosome recycling factor [Dehalococcoidia bacterium]